MRPCPGPAARHPEIGAVRWPSVSDPSDPWGDEARPPRMRLGRRLAWALVLGGALLFLLWWRLSDAFFAGNARSLLWVHLLVLGLAAAILAAVGRPGQRRAKALGFLAVGAVVMAVASLAGPLGLIPPELCCLDLDQEPRPADWQSGARLVAFQGSKSHDADESYGLVPATGEPPGTPARCVAYQEGRHHRLDSCSVVPGNVTRWDGTTWGPWTLQASWSGWGERLHEDVEQHPGRRTVVAYDAEGRPVAWWAGEKAPNGLFSTE